MAQQASKAGNSYDQLEFVGFYEALVSECYGGTAAEDVRYYSELFMQKWTSCRHTSSGAPSESSFVLVDLGCGSGRATLAILDCLVEHGRKHAISSSSLSSSSQGVLSWSPGAQLRIYCIDNSQAMLSAAESKVTAHLNTHPYRPAITVKFLRESFQDWHLPAPDIAADYIIVAAAGLHHVLETHQLQTCMQLMVKQLSPDGLCVVSYLPWSELCREPLAAAAGQSAQEFQVSGYTRKLLSRTVTTVSATKAQPGLITASAALVSAASKSGITMQFGETAAAGSAVGGMKSKDSDIDNTYRILNETFTLTKFVPLVGGADGCCPGPAGGCVDGGCVIEDGSRGEVAWSIQEGWQLRQIEREDLLHWGLESGLREAEDCCSARACKHSHHGTCCIVFRKLQP
jgi:SAM-dependent methyltransferase